MNNNQTETNESKSGIDFCSNSFEAAGQQLVNNYRCNEKKISSTDMWKIEKRRREFTRRTSIFAIN